MKKTDVPSEELLAEAQAMFARHGWKGFALAAPVPVQPQATDVIAANGCPAGTKPHTITYKDASGAWVTRTVCL